MHLLVREAAGLDETATAGDLNLAPADIVMLSFSDSDLGTMAAAWHDWGAERPSLRLANLARLRHPMSVDLFCEKTLPGTRAVLIRLLGGLDYWRYGCEELSRFCRARSIPLAIVAGDGRPDPRLDAYSTLPTDALTDIEALLDTGGLVNCRAALEGLLKSASGGGFPAFSAPIMLPAFGVCNTAPARSGVAWGSAALVCYRSTVLAGDAAPIDALADALAAQGLAVTVMFVPSLKASEAARWLRRELLCIAPDVIVNATAFSARDGETGSPLDIADCPVLQVTMAQSSTDVWRASKRGVGAADLAMHVALPEMDGRISAGAISFKEPGAAGQDLGFATLRHAPHQESIQYVAQLAAAWARLRRLRVEKRNVALMLSTYPGRSDQIAHAVGLDGPASAAMIIDELKAAGYAVHGAPRTGPAIVAGFASDLDVSFRLDEYEAAFKKLPEDFRASVLSAWGDAEADPTVRHGTFRLPVRRFGQLILAMQPERGDTGDRKAGYHDPNTPPGHGYIATYLWLRHVAKINALIHLGAHGTLEWLPGKAVALSSSCAPVSVLGPLPVIYPFIVNDPGEAAQAKRRIGAVTLGHRTPPLVETELDANLQEVERLVDEFSSADGLDPKRRSYLMGAVTDAVRRAGLAEVCGLSRDMADTEQLAKIDAFLCDVKELSIRDGLHILDRTELDAILRALDGRFIEPGPSGAPSRGRADVLPAGRNLYSIDPRGIPTQTAMANGTRAAYAIMDRYAEDHGEWPKSIVLDLWGSATLRTGGEELATAMALLGVKPAWDASSFRVSGFEIVPPPLMDRPRVDVTLRISGLFRDMFPTQLTLFSAAVQRVSKLKEDREFNPLTAFSNEAHRARIFGPAEGSYGAGVISKIDRGDWNASTDLGMTYLDQSGTAYEGENVGGLDGEGFIDRVRDADAFVHIQDHHETDLLTGLDYAAHEGGFAAAAAALGNTNVALYHGDTGRPETPKVRTLAEECSRIVSGRAISPRWIAGQMRHGFRGAAEIAATVDAAFAFAATAGTIKSEAFEQLYDAYVANEDVRHFIEDANPPAFAALCDRFNEAINRRLWRPRRNDLSPLHKTVRAEAAE